MWCYASYPLSDVYQIESGFKAKVEGLFGAMIQHAVKDPVSAPRAEVVDQT